GKTREASVVIASSDSDENARLTADVVISTNEDASVIINAQLVALSTAGGGKIFLRAGNYYCYNSVNIQDSITFEGEGANTVLHNVGAISAIIYTVGIQNAYLNNFYLHNDGDASVSLQGQITDDTVYFYNITSRVDVINRHNFWYCSNMLKCTAINGANGFIGCRYLTQCSSKSDIAYLTMVGFYQCHYITACIAYKVYRGFYGGLSHTSCRADTCTIGYEGTIHVNACTAMYCGQYGFYNCDGLTNNSGWSCLTISASFAFVATYRDCHGMTVNRAGQASVYYTSCTPEWGSSANPAADTAAGGWNVTA
ncbi:MAG: hypothetical protein WC346_15025, partial [Methanogenium sp.]